MKHAGFAVLGLTGLLCAPAFGADQPAIGVAPVALDAGPYVFDTAEQHGIKVSVIARELPRAFAMAFLPNGDMLFSERGGSLRLIRGATGANPVLDAAPVSGIPALDPPYRNGGLHEVLLAKFQEFRAHESSGAGPGQQTDDRHHDDGGEHCLRRPAPGFHLEGEN